MLEKIETLINQSKSFAILLDQNPEDHEYLCQEILKRAIHKKDIPIYCLPEASFEARDKWATIASPLDTQKSFPKKTSIKLSKEKYGIKEVAYKEEGGNLALIITSDNNSLLNEDIILEELLPEADLVFCFLSNSEKLATFKNRIQIPPEEKTIFLTPEGKTLTEKVYQIAQLFNRDILDDKEFSTLFFASLILETENFSQRLTNGSLKFAGELLEKNAKKDSILEIFEKDKKTNSTQLFGRALARTYADENLGVSWSFLNQRDIQKTLNGPLSAISAYQMLKKIRSHVARQKLYVLLWQSPFGINAIVTSNNEEENRLIDDLAKKMNASTQSKFLTIGPFDNFSKAEIYLREILRNNFN